MAEIFEPDTCIRFCVNHGHSDSFRFWQNIFLNVQSSDKQINFEKVLSIYGCVYWCFLVVGGKILLLVTLPIRMHIAAYANIYIYEQYGTGRIYASMRRAYVRSWPLYSVLDLCSEFSPQVAG